MCESLECTQVKSMLIKSGIDFLKIPKADLLRSCDEYIPRLPEPLFTAVLKAIDEIYMQE